MGESSRTTTSTFTQLLNSEILRFNVALRPQRPLHFIKLLSSEFWCNSATEQEIQPVRYILVPKLYVLFDGRGF